MGSADVCALSTELTSISVQKYAETSLAMHVLTSISSKCSHVIVKPKSMSWLGGPVYEHFSLSFETRHLGSCTGFLAASSPGSGWHRCKTHFTFTMCRMFLCKCHGCNAMPDVCISASDAKLTNSDCLPKVQNADKSTQEAQLLPRDSVMHRVSLNRAKCHINVHRIALDKSYISRMTFKVIQGHWKWHE